MVGGGVGIFLGLLLVFTVREPVPSVAKVSKSVSIGGILREYKRTYGLLFSNMTVCVLIIATFIRATQTTVYA